MKKSPLAYLLLASAVGFGRRAVASPSAEAIDGLWGVNYYAPFSLDYNELTRRGFDPRQTIRDDVTHFRRLGVDYIRVHCFDRQISRRDGSLADTRHLALLDYLVATAETNGLKMVLTPIAWYGWSPMTDDDRAGFSNLATMQDFTSKRELWGLQARFLSDFAAHTNRYTGRVYGNDPSILAFECVNEPMYPKDWPQTNVTAYIDTLVAALRAGGAMQPIFYNSWNGYNAAAGRSQADGVSCSAYPLGLLAGRPLLGHQLGRIKETTLKPDASLAGKLLMAYEFDAADTLDACLYPALAKMMRGEGIAFAAQFQYDPLALADENYDWPTHFLNLVYTPKKALSFAIAGRAFKAVKRGEPYAPDPLRLTFGPFRVDSSLNLSEMATETEFLYSNDTETVPSACERLARVWGCGSSSVVTSDGSGAYFFDRLAPGVWSVQVYPNAFTVANPFSGRRGTKVELVPGEVALTVRLPDLGTDYVVTRAPNAEAVLAQAKGGRVQLAPGAFVFSRADACRATDEVLRRWTEIPPFVSPTVPSGEARPRLRAELPRIWKAGEPVPFAVEGVFADRIGLELKSLPSGETKRMRTRPREIAGDLLTAGSWEAVFVAKGRAGRVREPQQGAFRLRIVEDYRDWNYLDLSGVCVVRPTGAPCTVQEAMSAAGDAVLRLTSRGFAKDASTVLQVRCDAGAQARFFPQAPTASVLVVRARATESATRAFSLTMVERDLKSWQYEVPLTKGWQDIRLPVACGRYCGEWSWVPKLKEGVRPDVGRSVCLRLELGAWLLGDGAANPQGLEIESVRVE